MSSKTEWVNGMIFRIKSNNKSYKKCAEKVIGRRQEDKEVDGCCLEVERCARGKKNRVSSLGDGEVVKR